MTNFQQEINRLEIPIPRRQITRLAPRRVRRQEARNRIRTAKSQRKAG
ncbi:MAG TPA: hypothetical protein V6C85_06520 [Allocoleopsis sp.]